jgi:hypothetical protein
LVRVESYIIMTSTYLEKNIMLSEFRRCFMWVFSRCCKPFNFSQFLTLSTTHRL